ncbi:hypothetical protein BC831DRAFT_471539, partial [Entophlyctis helioformis]
MHENVARFDHPTAWLGLLLNLSSASLVFASIYFSVPKLIKHRTNVLTRLLVLSNVLSALLQLLQFTLVYVAENNWLVAAWGFTISLVQLIEVLAFVEVLRLYSVLIEALTHRRITVMQIVVVALHFGTFGSVYLKGTVWQVSWDSSNWAVKWYQATSGVWLCFIVLVETGVTLFVARKVRNLLIEKRRQALQQDSTTADDTNTPQLVAGRIDLGRLNMAASPARLTPVSDKMHDVGGRAQSDPMLLKTALQPSGGVSPNRLMAALGRVVTSPSSQASASPTKPPSSFVARISGSLGGLFKPHTEQPPPNAQPAAPIKRPLRSHSSQPPPSTSHHHAEIQAIERNFRTILMLIGFILVSGAGAVVSTRLTAFIHGPPGSTGMRMAISLNQITVAVIGFQTVAITWLLHRIKEMQFGKDKKKRKSRGHLGAGGDKKAAGHAGHGRAQRRRHHGEAATVAG